MVLPEALADLLLPWYRACRRDLPWRRDRDPYRVWVSEIMLQQTRVEAVRDKYLHFLEALPDAAALAACPEDRLMKLWEGLGYYSRARNLQKAARVIGEEYGGVFPRSYAGIRSLPGIGDYTAGAIASICFDLPVPAVDGNVLRVCARLCASREDVLLPETKRACARALAERFPPAGCGDLNQALMELGATVCLPKGQPDCGGCPLKDLCLSRPGGLWRELPVRSARKPRVPEERSVLLLRCGRRIALRRRSGTGLLAGLWEFPSLSGVLTPQQALDQAEAWGCRPEALTEVRRRVHVFTHREWHMTLYAICCGETPEAFVWADPDELDRVYSLPSAFRRFLEDKPDLLGS